MLATDTSGAVVWKENYRPYGERVNTGNQSVSGNNSVWFAGKPFDSSTGLSYMGARYYDPVLGRFMGVDPVGFQETNIHSSNRYAYANNNPYKFVDPDGRYAELAVEVVSLSVGYMSLRENMRAGNTSAAITDGLGMLADIAGAALPGVPGVVGLGIKAAREAVAAEKIVYRFGDSAESAARLGRKSDEAEKVIGHHGVSVSTTKPPAGTACSSAACSNLEGRGFEVRPTPTKNDPGHHTVVMPKPVTNETAKSFNKAFGRD